MDGIKGENSSTDIEYTPQALLMRKVRKSLLFQLIHSDVSVSENYRLDKK